MDLQPTLRGPRVILRPLLEDDFESLFAAASDPLIWAIHPEPNRYQRPVFQTFFDRAIASKGAFAAIDTRTEEIIGSSRYYGLDGRTVKIGYTFLVRKYWGINFNQEMKQLMLDYAFRHVDTVKFEVGETNFRSRRALEKIGARFLENTVIDQKPYVVYEIVSH
jgi:RimJ/RimL family protein N-acetyltransferase